MQYGNNNTKQQPYFEKRLKFERFKGGNNILTIDLHNNFTVIAIIGRDAENNYDVELRLKENTVDKWDLIEKAEHLKFNENDKIHSSVLKTVSDFYHEGFFDYYIERYQYYLKCFDIGNETCESENK